MFTRSALLATTLFLAAASSGGAQQNPEPAGPARAFAGGSLQVAQPVGEFGDYIGAGFGLGGHFLYAIAPSSGLGLRVDGGFVNYGSERYSSPISSTIGGRILVDVTTSNNILLLGAGPQLMLPSGRVRPYLFGTAGLAYFVTESSLRGTRGGEDFANTTNFDDLTFAYGGGTGVYVPVRGGRLPISIDVGARFHRNGRARYLREGSIRDEPNGSISYTPIESETDLVTFHVGVSAALGKSRDSRR